MLTQEEFNDAVMIVTGGPAWDQVKDGLRNDIYQLQARALDAKTWDEVCEGRGFAKGLQYMINLRENTEKATIVEADNADL